MRSSSAAAATASPSGGTGGGPTGVCAPIGGASTSHSAASVVNHRTVSVALRESF